jgi:DNA-binding NtrC family response regulator
MDTEVKEVKEARPSPRHILIMEDESSVAQGLELILTEEGYVVDVAMTGRAALDTFENKGCDLLLADLRLPDIDGMDVIKKVKTSRPDTEVIVITGYASVSSAVEGFQAGIHEYLSKPFSDDQIISAVEHALEEKIDKPAARTPVDFESREGLLIQKREVIRVLNRTADDEAFTRELMNKGSAALEEYQLSPEAKAAIISGDLMWINAHVGELTQKQLMFVYRQLEREVW